MSRLSRHHSLNIEIESEGNSTLYPVYSPSVRVSEQSNGSTLIQAELDGLFKSGRFEAKVKILAVGGGNVEETFSWEKADVSLEPLMMGNTRFKAMIR